MDDLISRQAAIDAIRVFYADECALVDSIEEQLEKLPSAQLHPCKDAVSKADVLETYAELYDVFDDNKEIKNELHKIYDKINALQAAQPEIIRCKDCKHMQEDKLFGQCWCNGNMVKFDDYCSYAERRQDGQ